MPEEKKGLMPIPDDLNLFMMCEQLNRNALSALPPGYHVRNCRRDELDIWKAIHFDDPAQAREHMGYMERYFANVYRAQGDLFFRKCLFVCDERDMPVGTCFVWKAYGKISTVHWFKVVKQYEGRGIGRALLSAVLREVAQADYPIFLHTQPGSYRAIKLYADFGFSLLSDEQIGQRANHLRQCLPILSAYMPAAAFDKLTIRSAPAFFLAAADSSQISQF